MRTAISSLILAAGLASAAYAQDPAQPAAPAPAAPAPAAPAPADQAAPPAAAPAPPAQPTPVAEVPALPTTGDAAQVISVLENVCKPAVRGQKLDDLAKGQGFKQNRRDQTWVKPLGGQRQYQVIVFPQGSNKNVCFAELRFAIGGEPDIAKALNVWAFRNELDPTANYTQPQDPDGLKRVRRSWEHLTSNSSTGLNFSSVRRPDDSPLNGKYDTATLQYQERKF